jgi:hypothetical protein
MQAKAAPYFLNSNIHHTPGNLRRCGSFFDGIFGNTGNSVITSAMLSFLGSGPEYLTPANSLPSIFQGRIGADEAERINGEYTDIILTAQDYLRADWPEEIFATALYNLRQTSLPLIVHSLGANSFGGRDDELHTKLSGPQLAFFKEVGERSTSIAVRGEYTADVLTRMGIRNFSVTGCPTHFVKGAGRQFVMRPWDADKHVGVGGYFPHAEHCQLHYYFQDERIFAKALYFNDDYDEDDFKHHSMDFIAYPQYHAFTHQVLLALRDRRASLFADIGLWERDIAARVNLLVGTRVHGAIMALNAGIPAIVTSGDMRATEMCDLFGIPHFPKGLPEDIPLRQLFESYDYSAMSGRYSRLLQGWNEWLTLVGLARVKLRPATSNWLTELAMRCLQVLPGPLVRKVMGSEPQQLHLVPDAIHASRTGLLTHLLDVAEKHPAEFVELARLLKSTPLEDIALADAALTSRQELDVGVAEVAPPRRRASGP